MTTFRSWPRNVSTCLKEFINDVAPKLLCDKAGQELTRCPTHAGGETVRGIAQQGGMQGR